MPTADKIRNNIISKLLTISNEEYLTALYRLVEKSNADDDIVKLTENNKNYWSLVKQISKTAI